LLPDRYIVQCNIAGKGGPIMPAARAAHSCPDAPEEKAELQNHVLQSSLELF
jgi:hypothetical protein